MKEIRKAARERMKGFCRVCAVCDGRACAGEVPGMGSLGTSRAVTANLAALARWRLKMRLLHDVADPKIRLDFLGKPLRLPVLAAPIGGVSFNMGGAVSEEAYIAAAVKGQIALLADGGVRGGADVLKLLALGADAVMIGRPFSVAAVGGLKEGVLKYLQQIESELVSAMVLTGTPDVAAVGSEILSA